MKAVIYTGPRTMHHGEADDPAASKGEALIAVEAVGICGSDMHAWAGHDERRPAPLILGHEAAGTVIEGPLKGKRVAINPLVTCMHCQACLSGRNNLCARREIISMPPRQGAFAERIAMPAGNLVEIPDHVPVEKAALTEPFACSYHAVRLAGAALARPLAEQSAVVIGGGAIGLAAGLCLADAGCHDIWIAETNPLRHKSLAAAGPFSVYDPAGRTGPKAASIGVVIDAYGGSASRQAASALAMPGGVIAHIGLESGDGGLDIRRMTLQEISFIGTYSFTAADYRETAKAIFSGRLGPLDWFEERSLAEGPAAFDDIAAGKVAAPKVILRP